VGLRSIAIPASIALLATLLVAQAQVQVFQQGVPPGADPQTGARPGNQIGTGSSLPRSETSSNISPSDTRSVLAPSLPRPAVGENASIRDYLLAARTALAVGNTGEAQQALEMAETRRLDRSVPLFQTTAPVADAQVAKIEDALHTLAAGDRRRAMQIIGTVGHVVQIVAQYHPWICPASHSVSGRPYEVASMVSDLLHAGRALRRNPDGPTLVVAAHITPKVHDTIVDRHRIHYG